ncbi:head-tail connector protein [Pseudogemmobacter sonorensis]|uniref:head-tail connector protein n=1 Tax=Pseudogemmobacter sonorensis TaxID=2989681 RepID=UPI0036CAD9A7
MWYPVSDIVTGEPVSEADAQAQIFADEDDFEVSIEMLIASARAHVEAYCNRQFATHAMAWACDGFGDFRRLPAAPATAITAISYLNPAGEETTLDAANYILRADGMEPWIALADGAQWPQRQPGSRVTVVGIFGGCPPDVKHAMLLLIGDGFTTRENVARPVWTAVDALLANHRRGAWV